MVPPHKFCFDLNDTFTQVQAGPAEKGLTYFYSLKAIAELRNSCRIAVGFQPTGKEPGICEQPVKPGEPVASGF